MYKGVYIYTYVSIYMCTHSDIEIIGRWLDSFPGLRVFGAVSEPPI